MKTILNIFFIKFLWFVGFITTFLFSCVNNQNEIIKVDSINIKILNKDQKYHDLNKIISPYKDKIRNLQDSIGYSKKNLSKIDGKLNSSLGNFLADVVLSESNIIFEEKRSNNIDFCLLNFGGIRSNLNKGYITKNHMFSIMPFENKAVVAKIEGKKVLELVNFLNNENIAHPVSGIKLKFNKTTVIDVLIRGEKFDENKNYYVVTSDFLLNGGDNMFFLKNPIETFSLDIGIREILINYVKKKDSVVSSVDDRIIRF